MPDFPALRATALTVDLRAGPDADAEAEPVIVEAGADVVRVVLDDGRCVDFDRVELAAAIAA